MYLVIQQILFEHFPFAKDILDSEDIVENKTEQNPCPYEA